MKKFCKYRSSTIIEESLQQFCCHDSSYLIAKINLYVDVPSVPDQNINLPELIYAKQSLINDKAVDVSGVPEHGVNLFRLIDDPTREIGR